MNFICITNVKQNKSIDQQKNKTNSQKVKQTLEENEIS